MRVAILGYGTIGRYLAQGLRSDGCNVAVWDEDAASCLEARNAGFETPDSARSAASDRNMIIGCSGRQSIDRNVITALRHGTYVVSASSEQREIDLDYLIQTAAAESPYFNDSGELLGTVYKIGTAGNEVTLVANGYPINFWGMDSMPDQVSDIIMTIILLCAAHVAMGTSPSGQQLQPTIDSGTVNEIAEHYAIAEEYARTHQ